MSSQHAIQNSAPTTGKLASENFLTVCLPQGIIPDHNRSLPSFCNNMQNSSHFFSEVEGRKIARGLGAELHYLFVLDIVWCVVLITSFLYAA